MSNFYDVFKSSVLDMLVNCTEFKHKSHIESVKIFGKVDSDSAKFYLGFELENGDYEEVCMLTVDEPNLSSDDVRVITAYKDLVNNYCIPFSTDFKLCCMLLGVYEN